MVTGRGGDSSPAANLARATSRTQNRMITPGEAHRIPSRQLRCALGWRGNGCN
jgi:hypothetical protein